VPNVVPGVLVCHGRGSAGPFDWYVHVLLRARTAELCRAACPSIVRDLGPNRGGLVYEVAGSRPERRTIPSSTTLSQAVDVSLTNLNPIDMCWAVLRLNGSLTHDDSHVGR
jgi:hypothetical protein